MEGLKPWPKKEDLPKPDGKSATEDFRIKQSKSHASGTLKEYCRSDIGPEIFYLADPAEIWTHLSTMLKLSLRSYKLFCSAEFHNMSCYVDIFFPVALMPEQNSSKFTEIMMQTFSPEIRL